MKAVNEEVENGCLGFQTHSFKTQQDRSEERQRERERERERETERDT